MSTVMSLRRSLCLSWLFDNMSADSSEAVFFICAVYVKYAITSVGRSSSSSFTRSLSVDLTTVTASWLVCPATWSQAGHQATASPECCCATSTESESVRPHLTSAVPAPLVTSPLQNSVQTVSNDAWSLRPTMPEVPRPNCSADC